MFDRASFKTGILLFTAWSWLSPAVAEQSAAAEEPAAATTWESWRCKYCPEIGGTEGWVEPGIGYQSEDSYRFGRYSGLKDDGVFGNADGYLMHREEDGRYYEIRGRNLGLQSRDIQVEGGDQGKYKLFLEYDQLPSFNDDTTESPYGSQSGNRLSLPQNWVPDSSTQDMPTLQQDLTDVTIKTERKRLKADFAYLPFRKWEITAHFMHEKKDGRHDVGTTFGFSETSILPVPVEYLTNELGFGIGYTGRKLQAKVAYDGSYFDEEHNHRGLVWQNPYVATSEPNGFGQYALPPDNNYHKLSATLGYDVLQHTRLNAHLAVGRLKQDGNFLPYTINPDLGGSLPTNDLDGEVKSTLARLGVSSRPLPRLRLNANYTYSDRDNDSNRNSYDYVVTDLYNADAARKNKPYSFKQHLFRSSAAYRLSNRTDLSAGFDYDRMERTYQEVDDTEEKTLWGELRVRPHEMVDASIKYTHANRSNSDYDGVSEITQNSRMRLYNLASRTRNKASGALTLTPASALTLGLSVDYYKDDYDNTSLGLTEARGVSYTADASYLINENLTTTVYFTRERLQSDQAGSQGFSQPDWFMDDENTTRTVGVGINWAAIPDRLDIGADLVYSDYKGKTNYDNAAGYPDLESTLKSARLHGTYRIRENTSLRLAYWYEDFSEDDWAKDGIGVATLPTVLGLGADTQDYDVHVIAASIRSEFE
jgi:MtrB/PioB family decaheme-associated outer membrane protein